MVWFRLDDHFPDNPKVLRAGTDAMWLYVAGGCYCSRHLTDGLIPKCAVSTLTTQRRADQLAVKLETAGLWIDRGDDYEVKDFLEYNPSREQVEDDRRKARERRANGARASRERKPNVICPDPTRPDPKEQPTGARKRGTRIPDEFEVDAEMVEWVERECPRVDWRWQTSKFVDHFKAASGQRGVKADWLRAWRNWMRTEQERAR